MTDFKDSDLIPLCRDVLKNQLDNNPPIEEEIITETVMAMLEQGVKPDDLIEEFEKQLEKVREYVLMKYQPGSATGTSQ